MPKIQTVRDSGRAHVLFFAVNQPLYEVTSPPWLAFVRFSLYVPGGLGPANPPKPHWLLLSVNGFTIPVQLNHAPATLRGEKQPLLMQPCLEEQTANEHG